MKEKGISKAQLEKRPLIIDKSETIKSLNLVQFQKARGLEV